MNTTLPGFKTYPGAVAVAPVVEQVAQSLGAGAPPVALVMGMIAVESGFKATAYRAEPAINDASRGLMQILLRTAQAVGFKGEANALYDPATNVRYGMSYLRDSIRAHGGDVWAGVSAYNNGSGKRATRDLQTCAWRKADGSCGEYFNIKAGQFLNQPYVDKVMAKAALFGYTGGAATAGPSGVLGLLLVLGLGLALVRRHFT